jgi:uncharacterized protein with HEPN domain
LPFKDDASRWRDMRDAIILIEQFVAGMDFAAYGSDAKTQSAVERQLLILSEAAKLLAEAAETQCPNHDWRGLRGMGDVLRHAYHRVDDEVVWNTIITDLPRCVHASKRPLPTQIRLARYHFPRSSE